jgi:hypothetical protein
MTLNEFKAEVARLELQTSRGLQLKKELEVDMPCGLRFKVLPDNYATLCLDIFPVYNEDRPIPCNQFEVELNWRKDIMNISINPHANGEDYIHISNFIHHIERIMRSVA